MALTLLVASGVALAVTKIATPRDDVLYGTNRSDILSGLGGNDVLYGRGGGDSSPEGSGLIGAEGDDIIYGGAGNDVMEAGNYRLFMGNPNWTGYKDQNILYGGRGNDDVLGDGGSDVLYGGPGADWIDNAYNVPAVRGDIIYGGGANDFITSYRRPAVKDIVHCGTGTDVVRADREDQVGGDCEKVVRP